MTKDELLDTVDGLVEYPQTHPIELARWIHEAFKVLTGPKPTVLLPDDPDLTVEVTGVTLRVVTAHDPLVLRLFDYTKIGPDDIHRDDITIALNVQHTIHGMQVPYHLPGNRQTLEWLAVALSVALQEGDAR